MVRWHFWMAAWASWRYVFAILFVRAASWVSLRRSDGCLSWGRGGMGAAVSNIYHGVGFLSDGLGRNTGISVMCLYLGGGLFGDDSGLHVVGVVMVVRRSA